MPEPHPPRDTFEPRPGDDVDTRLVRRVGYVLIAVVAATLLSIVAWKRVAATRPAAAGPIAIVRGAPALQAVPTADRAAFDREKAQRLTTTGWVDREHGIVHIPIDRAIALTIARAAAAHRPAGQTPAEAPR